MKKPDKMKITSILLVALLFLLIFTYPNITWQENLQLLVLFIALFIFRKNSRILRGLFALVLFFLIMQLKDPYIEALRKGIVDYSGWFRNLNIINIIIFSLIILSWSLAKTRRNIRFAYNTESKGLTIAVVITLIFLVTVSMSLSLKMKQSLNLNLIHWYLAEAVILSIIVFGNKLSVTRYQLPVALSLAGLLIIGGYRVGCSFYHYNYGENCADAGQFNQAISSYNQALNLNPVFTRTYYKLGKVLYEKEEWRQASQKLKIALRLKPGFSKADLLLTETYKKGAMWNELIERYKRGINNEDNLDAHKGLVSVYISQKMRNELAQLIREEKVPVDIKIEADNFSSCYELGLAYSSTNKMLDKSLSMFEKAVLLEPAELNAHFQLGRVYARKGMFKKAVKEFKETIERNPSTEYEGVQGIDNKTLISFFINMIHTSGSIKAYISNFSSPELLRLLKIAGVKIVTNGEIGLTGIKTPVAILAQSAGWDVGNFAHIFVNGEDIFPKGYNRGYTIAIINQETGEIEDIASFDIYGLKEKACNNMISFIKKISNKRVVIAVVRDEATWRLTESAFISLKSIGANKNLAGDLRCSHTILGAKGAKSGEASEAWDRQFGNPVGIIVLRKKARL